MKISKFYYSPAQIKAREEYNYFYKIPFPNVSNQVLTNVGWREYSDHIIEDNDHDTPLEMFHDMPFFKTQDPKTATIDKSNDKIKFNGKEITEKEFIAMESR
jgi:hypothetical protein